MSIELVQLAELRDKVTELTRRLEKQSLLMEAMWQFLKVEFELEDADLEAMARKLDLADGVEDGKKAPAAAPTLCPACEEPVKGSRDQCFWCGHRFPVGLFDS